MSEFKNTIKLIKTWTMTSIVLFINPSVLLFRSRKKKDDRIMLFKCVALFLYFVARGTGLIMNIITYNNYNLMVINECNLLPIGTQAIFGQFQITPSTLKSSLPVTIKMSYYCPLK